MRALITGSAGFVGSHVVEHLLINTDWELIGLDSFNHRGDSLRVCSNPRYKIYCCDLSAPITHRLKQIINNVDYIINLASESHVDRSITNPVPFIENNIKLAINLLEFAKHQPKLKKFIQVSTDEVFGAALEGQHHKEWDHHLPSNPYSASKSSQEMVAISYWRTYGIPLIVTNTMNIIGERQDAEKFVPMLISKIIKGEEVTIHGDPSYIGKRYYLHARNMADALLFILNRVPIIKYEDSWGIIIKPERFNIVGEVEVNNLQLAQKVAAILGKPLRYKLVDFHKARPGHDRRYALDGSKLAEKGWRAPVAFKDALRKTVEWTLKNRVWLD